MIKTLVLAFSLSLLGSGSAFAQNDAEGVTFERILNAESEPDNWLTYSGGYDSQRHTTLDQIDLGNVDELELKWVFQAQSLQVFETSPLVVDGIMYLTEAPNTVVALDAKRGRVFWRYEYTPSNLSRPCCGRVNRGLGILGQTLFMATIDAKLIAIDATTGQPLWVNQIADASLGYAMTLAPLIIKDKVIIGVAGALALSRLLASLLFGVPTPALHPFVRAPLVIALATATAAFLPAFRATRVDPGVILHEE